MFTEQNVDIEKIKTMRKNIKEKLYEEERKSIEGNITEYECAYALRDIGCPKRYETYLILN